MIDSKFLPHEAQKIKAIPLCVVPQSDYVYWSLEKNRLYSVKSGYKLLCEEERVGGGSFKLKQAKYGGFVVLDLELESTWKDKLVFLESLYRLSTNKSQSYEKENSGELPMPVV